MKKVLITGANSYIGRAFMEYCKNDYDVDELDVVDDKWRNFDFSKYDIVFHVAGIAHVSTNPKMEELYFKINRDLAISVAKKAKEEKVKQFIFMSSMIIYGNDERIGKQKVISINTKPHPTNFYGQSKLDADLYLQEMATDDFKVAISRTPMVYGPNCKGNFSKLVSISKKKMIFPKVNNKRSMIYIKNLCMYIKDVIDCEYSGIFYPQNKETTSTNDIIKEFRKCYNRKTHFCILMNPLIRFMSLFFRSLTKVYGSKIYDNDTKYFHNLELISFIDSIKEIAENDTVSK